MGIAERIARITAGKSSDFGARPSKEQERMKDRSDKALKTVKSEKRKWIRQQKKEAEKNNKVFRHNPPTLAACRNTRCGGKGSAREEILGAMRGLDPTSTAYVMFKHAQDRSSYPEALAGIVTQALDLHITRGWKTRSEDRGKDIIRSMCRLALFELNDPKCEKCGGTGLGKRGGVCRRCKGDKKLRISDKQRSIALGINYHQYRNTYGKRFDAVVRMVKGIGRGAIQQIHFNLYGDKDWDSENV